MVVPKGIALLGSSLKQARHVLFLSIQLWGGCLFILVRFLSYGVEYLQMWALVGRLSGGIAPWCVGVGDSRACCALFGGVLRVGTYSRWGRG